ncbi:MAG: hypothetical protein AAFY52_04005, partial [Pseudomonadota bacterium]
MKDMSFFDDYEVGFDIPAKPGMDEADIQTPCLQPVDRIAHHVDGDLGLALPLVIIVEVLHRALIGLDTCKFQTRSPVNR